MMPHCRIMDLGMNVLMPSTEALRVSLYAGQR
jgi:hypothetical protein